MLISKHEIEKVQNKWKEELHSRRNKLKDKSRILFVSDGNNAGSAIYLNNKMKMCREFNIPYCSYWVPKLNEYSLRQLIPILGISFASKMHEFGNQILIQLPLAAKETNIFKCIEDLPTFRDVDGMKPDNQLVIPPVANGIRYFLNHYDKKCIPVVFRPGDLALVIGRSEWTGKPIAQMLSDTFNLTVITANSQTPVPVLKDLLNMAKITVVCAGNRDIITNEMMEGIHPFGSATSMIIDVGTNRVDGKLYGDVNVDNPDEYKNTYITPVPGGVGPLTVLGLIDNSITLDESGERYH